MDAMKHFSQIWKSVCCAKHEDFLQELENNDFHCDFIVLNNGGVVCDNPKLSGQLSGF